MTIGPYSIRSERTLKMIPQLQLPLDAVQEVHPAIAPGAYPGEVDAGVHLGPYAFTFLSLHTGLLGCDDSRLGS